MSPEGRIYAAGKDDYGQVSGPKSFTGVNHIAIAAGTDRAAVIDPDGQLHIVGKPLPGVQPPTLGNFTAVALFNDVGFALRESAPEKHTGPISPGSTFHLSRDGSGTTIPWGSSIDHTVDGVIRAFDPASTQLFWVNEKEETQALFPDDSMPSSLIHYVPSGATVDSRESYRTTVIPPLTTANNNIGKNFSVNLGQWIQPYHQSPPYALCFGTMCSAGAGSNKHAYLSNPITLSSTNSGSSIPVLSVRQLSPVTWSSTLSIRGSSNPADSTFIIVDKDNVDLNPPVSFVITTGNWGNDPGTKVELTAQANLTRNVSAMDFQIMATASSEIPGVKVTPEIWKQMDGHDELVISATPVSFSSGKFWTTTGTFTPPGAGTYYANATVLYTVPAVSASGVAAGTQNYGISFASNPQHVPIAQDSWDAQGYYDAYVSHKTYWWRVNIATAMNQENLQPNWDHFDGYGYVEQFFMDSHHLARKSTIPGSKSDDSYPEKWPVITKSRVIVLSQSSKLHTSVDSEDSHSGGAPLKQSGSTLSAFIDVIEQVGEVAIGRWKPALGALFDAKNLAASLIGLTDKSKPPGAIWEEE